MAVACAGGAAAGNNVTTNNKIIRVTMNKRFIFASSENRTLILIFIRCGVPACLCRQAIGS